MRGGVIRVHDAEADAIQAAIAARSFSAGINHRATTAVGSLATTAAIPAAVPATASPAVAPTRRAAGSHSPATRAKAVIRSGTRRRRPSQRQNVGVWVRPPKERHSLPLSPPAFPFSLVNNRLLPRWLRSGTRGRREVEFLYFLEWDLWGKKMAGGEIFQRAFEI